MGEFLGIYRGEGGRLNAGKGLVGGEIPQTPGPTAGEEGSSRTSGKLSVSCVGNEFVVGGGTICQRGDGKKKTLPHTKKKAIIRRGGGTTPNSIGDRCPWEVSLRFKETLLSLGYFGGCCVEWDAQGVRCG